MKDMDWKEEALKLYKAGCKVTEIGNKLGKSRKTISEYINHLPELAALNAARKNQALAARKKYKRDWKRKSSVVDAALMKRQHDIDVLVLSKEQYFNE